MPAHSQALCSSACWRHALRVCCFNRLVHSSVLQCGSRWWTFPSTTADPRQAPAGGFALLCFVCWPAAAGLGTCPPAPSAPSLYRLPPNPTRPPTPTPHPCCRSAAASSTSASRMAQTWTQPTLSTGRGERAAAARRWGLRACAREGCRRAAGALSAAGLLLAGAGVLLGAC